METQELYEALVRSLFPKDITDHFDIVHIESQPGIQNLVLEAVTEPQILQPLP